MVPVPRALEAVRPDDAPGLDGWFALQVRSHAHDAPALPPPCRLCHAHRFSWPGVRQEAWVVRDGPDVVAAATLVLPEWDDPDHGFGHVLVDPAHRRRGLGARLLAHLAARAGEVGRARLFLDVPGPLDAPGPGDAFVESAGARLGLREKRRRLVLPPTDPQVLVDLAAAAGHAARGYRLVRWTGPTPPAWQADLAALVARMSTDAPTGELEVAPRHWDADRVATRDAARAANGAWTVVTAAQAGDGHLVAYTEIVGCAGQPAFAEQCDTLVAPAHRGHRLGLRIKLANLDLLRRTHPAVRAVDTFNADENRWMIAVNEAMGFAPLRAGRGWELVLAPAAAAQAGRTSAISAAASGP